MPRRVIPLSIGPVCALILLPLSAAPAGGHGFAPDAALEGALPNALSRAWQQLGLNPSGYPMYTNGRGTWVTTNASGWTSGFFPGSLWYAYELTGNANWLDRAQTWTGGLAGQQYNTTTHDVGFMIGRSYINGHRLTGRSDYRSVLLNAANSVAQRYSPTVGCIRALGDKDATTGEFLVGLDTMANLDLLLYAARHGGSPAWRDMVISHGLRTAAELIRPDGGTIHTVYFDTATGQVLRKGTYQGYSDDSTWTRGQAWVIYGYAMIYRETGDRRFLDIARRTADYYLRRVPAGWIPPWDFDDPRSNPPKDSSSAAVAAAAFFELSRLADSAVDSRRYWDAACGSLAALCSPGYLSSGASSQGILLHGAYNVPDNTGIDCSVVWGDHYFLQAIQQYRWLTTPVAPTRTSRLDWQNVPLPWQRGRFQVSFEAIAGGDGIDASVALTAGPVGAYTNCPVIVRFNPSGYIDVRNSIDYQAISAVRYQPGVSYRISLDVDVPTRRYSVYVQPEGGEQVCIAREFGFRAEEAGVTYLDNLAIVATAGSHQVGDLKLFLPASGN